ncbi:hypothetical protein A3I27_01785 [Candidatus Giovannonibacteria bacterium RIFCSPLOWO2_02_FULL_43_11b]|nr:MAG: hypothetical protein A3I27_01785 [Candidatus Giovannonibacteria bacterium RIFCSPLOWO2_02_FULL_43_11b]
MKKVPVLLLGVLLFVSGSAFAQDCGNNRQFFVPAGVGSPGEYANSIGTTFAELQKLNPSLTEKNFRAGSAICVPIKSDAYWAQLERDKATWEQTIADLRGELKTSNDKMWDLKAALGTAYIGWRLGVGTLVALIISLSIVGRKLYRRTHRDSRRTTLLDGPSYIKKVVQRLSSFRATRRQT